MRRHWALAAICGLMAIFMVGLDGAGLLIGQRHFVRWPKADAVVVGYERTCDGVAIHWDAIKLPLPPLDGGSRGSALCRVYKYQSDGHDRLAEGPNIAQPWAVRDFPVGSPVVVAYDPQKAGSALSSRDVWHPAYWLGSLIGNGAMATVALIVVLPPSPSKARLWLLGAFFALMFGGYAVEMIDGDWLMPLIMMFPVGALLALVVWALLRKGRPRESHMRRQP